jgi:hypothetical protein
MRPYSACLLIAVFALNAVAIAQSTEQLDPWKEWVNLPPPANSGIGCPNYSHDAWVVSSNAGLVAPSGRDFLGTQKTLPEQLQAFQKQPGRKVFSKLDDHRWLLGTDAGEFGGGLWLIDETTGSITDVLQDSVSFPANVHGIMKTNQGAYILTGLAHLSMDTGALYFLPANGSAKDLRKTADLGSAPSSFVQDDENSFLIVTNGALLRLKRNGSLESLHKYNLASLYPNSVALDSEKNVYIGMRFFVLKLSPVHTGYAEKWMVPKRCRKFKIDNYDCKCTAK